MDGWKNKVYSLIKGPGWKPGAPWTGHLHEVPEVTLYCEILKTCKFNIISGERPDLLQVRTISNVVECLCIHSLLHSAPRL